MTAYKHLKIKKTDGVARITLARPKHNVLDIEMMTELNAELDLLGVDAELKCAVILGEGPSWCAGVEVADHKPEMVSEMIAVFNGIFERIDKIDVPVIAGVHGACLGGGMEVAIACDVIVAAKSASFGQPEIKLGFFPPYAAIRLPQLIGAGQGRRSLHDRQAVQRRRSLADGVCKPCGRRRQADRYARPVDRRNQNRQAR